MRQDIPDVVVKLGGSLFNLPGLATRVSDALRRLDCERPLIVPGGGAFAEAVRTLAPLHQLPDEASHRLACRAMSLAASFLAELDQGFLVAPHPGEASAAWRTGRVPIANVLTFADVETWPASWDFTSDSIAASLARDLSAPRLVLFKSTDRPPGDWNDVAASGAVDVAFPELAKGLPAVDWVNLRGLECDVIASQQREPFLSG